MLFLTLGYSAGIKTRTFQVYSCQQHLWLAQPLSSEVCGKVHYGHRESWLEKLVVFSFFGVLLYLYLKIIIIIIIVDDTLSLFDDEVRQCFAECTAVDTPDFTWQQAQLSLSRGGLGLRRVSYHSPATYVASAVSSGLSHEVCRYLHHSINLYTTLLIHLIHLLLTLLTTAVPHSLRSSCQTKLRNVSSRNYLITPLQSTGLVYYPFHHLMPQLGYQLLHPLAWAFTWSLPNFR